MHENINYITRIIKDALKRAYAWKRKQMRGRIGQVPLLDEPLLTIVATILAITDNKISPATKPALPSSKKSEPQDNLNNRANKYGELIATLMFEQDSNIPSLSLGEQAMKLVVAAITKEKAILLERPILEFLAHYIEEAVLPALTEPLAQDSQLKSTIHQTLQSELPHFYYLNPVTPPDSYDQVIAPLLTNSSQLASSIANKIITQPSPIANNELTAILRDCFIKYQNNIAPVPIPTATPSLEPVVPEPILQTPGFQPLQPITATPPAPTPPILSESSPPPESNKNFDAEYYSAKQKLELMVLNLKAAAISYTGVIVGTIVAIIIGFAIAGISGAIFACGLGAFIGYLCTEDWREVKSNQLLQDGMYLIKRDANIRNVNKPAPKAAVPTPSLPPIPLITTTQPTPPTPSSPAPTTAPAPQAESFNNGDPNSVLSYENNQICLSIDDKGWYISITNSALPRLLSITNHSTLEEFHSHFGDGKPLENSGAGDVGRQRINLADQHVTDIMLMLDRAFPLISKEKILPGENDGA